MCWQVASRGPQHTKLYIVESVTRIFENIAYADGNRSYLFSRERENTNTILVGVVDGSAQVTTAGNLALGLLNIFKHNHYVYVYDTWLWKSCQNPYKTSAYGGAASVEKIRIYAVWIHPVIEEC